jgi:hypothetical protein
MNTAATILTFLVTNGPQIGAAVSSLVTAASIVNTMIPPGAPGTFQAGVKQFINALSVGFGHAKPTGLVK